MLLPLLLLAGVLSPFRLSAQSIRSTNTTQSALYDDGTETEPDTTNQLPEGIIYDSGTEADSVLRNRVYAFRMLHRAVKLTSVSNPHFNPTGAQQHNPAHKLDGKYYADLGALGQTALSLLPFLSDNETQLPFLFQVQNPYTSLGYGSSLNKDYQINIIHTQNIRPRWNIAFLYDLISRDGLYTNSEVTKHTLNISTNYYSPDARYQMQAALSLNRHRQQENGGVQNDTTCWIYPRQSGVPVNMYYAQNQWRNLDIRLHQSYNTVRQFQKIKPRTASVVDTIFVMDTALKKEIAKPHTYDTIVGYDTIEPHKPHTYNTGVIALDLAYSRHRRIFYDNQADSWFYTPSSLDTTFYYDSTMHHRLSADLYWTNDAYMSHRWNNPIVLLAGLRPEINKLSFANLSPDYNEVDISPFAQATISMGRLRLKASAEEVTGNRRNGDYRLAATVEGTTRHNARLALSAASEAHSPDIMYYRNEGVYSWNYGDDHYDKIKTQRLDASFCYVKPDTIQKAVLHSIDARLTSMLISDNVWFNSNMTPMQGNSTGMLLRANISAHISLGWFNIRLQETLQHSSDNEVVRVPLFATKNSIFADVYLFHRSLRLQTGFDLRYHTRFLADGWNPVLGTFYRQDNVEVGDYLVADFWITLQIKRSTIYLKANHFNAPLEEILGMTPSYFSLPHYPMEGFGLFWGVTWKFFD